MTCGRKLFRRGVVEATADCQDCDWEAYRRNALGLAAQHHDRTGHHVIATETWSVQYALPEVIRRITAEVGH